MRFAHLALRGLRYHRRDHLGVLFAVAVGAAVLAGALVVGDSTRHTLRHRALQRLGQVENALFAPDTPFAETLADRLGERLGVPVAPVLREPAVAVAAGADGRRQAGEVRVLGVDRRFSLFAATGNATRAPAPRAGEVALSGALAAALGVAPGDRVSLRFAAPSRLPRDAPLAGSGGAPTLLGTATVVSVVPDEALGAFSLESGMRAPNNAFVELDWLQRLLGREERVNMLVLGGLPGGGAGAAARAQAGLREVFLPSLVGLRARRIGDVALLESERVFLEPAVASAALATPGAVGALTWLVNGISKAPPGSRGTPYSFVTALSPARNAALGVVPEGMRDDEILLNRWCAERIDAAGGDRVQLSWSLPLPGGGFAEGTRTFTVRDILPMERAAREAPLVPDFPGLTDAERCRDWRIGLPLEERALRDEANERYWREYRATPKAFVTLAAGRAMWGNRWGELTAARFAPAELPKGADTLAGRLDPAAFGLVFSAVREDALRSVARATDLGGLFGGMSVFLLASTLVLAGLLFAFGIERRAGETGTLLALGFTPARVAAAYGAEILPVAAVGAVAGSIAGKWYAAALLAGLRGSWSGALPGVEILPYAEPWTVPAAATGAFLASLAALLLALRRQLRMAARELLAHADAEGAAVPDPAPASRLWSAAAAAATVAAGALIAWGSRSAEDAAPTFFAAGSLLLTAALCAMRRALARLEAASGGNLTVTALATRSLARRPGRSLAVFALLACGSFTVFAAAAMRADPAAAPGRSGGGGGFALVGEASLPLRAGAVEEALTRTGAAGDGVSVIALKVRRGDDASCLNLNRAAAPSLVGVDPAVFRGREAFVPGGEGRGTWDLLTLALPPGVVPGLVGDQDTARWNLRARTGPADGEEIEYRDARGESFRVRLVGALPARKSLFQGMVLIPEGEFVRRYPAEDGFRLVLLESPERRAAALAAALGRELGRFGLVLRTPAAHLAPFYAVEHTYQQMFLVLGGMGLLLGTAGLAVVILRNILERRAELALLAALGFSRGRIGAMLCTEHLALFALGLGAGTLGALIAALPALRAPGSSVPVADLAVLAFALLAAGVLATAAAAFLGLRGPIVPALRRE